MIDPKNNPEGFLATLAAIGVFVGLGKVLASTESLTFRLVAGRCITSAGIGAAAGATTLMFPSADPIVMYGVAAALASLGTSAVEAAVKKIGITSSNE